jgi:hypothetical protein
MSQNSETRNAPKNRSWMFLVAGLIVLVTIGILTS